MYILVNFLNNSSLLPRSINVKLVRLFIKKVLLKTEKNYRLRNDREFVDVEIDKIIEIYNVFNFVNKILNTEEKLNNYIKNNFS